MKIARKFSLMLAGVILAAGVLLGCESTPDHNWAQGRDAYNKIGKIIFDYRAPCVADLAIEDGGVENAGPDHPRCYIDDEPMSDIAVVLAGADAVLREMDAAAEAGGGPDYARLVTRLEGFMLQLIAAQTAAEARRDAGG